MNKGIIRILLIIMAMCLLSASLVGAIPLSEESQSESSQPESSQPESSQPESSQSDTSQPESSQPESSQPETSQPDTSQPDTSQPDASQPDAPLGVSGVSISFSLPRGWYTKTARVGVALTDIYNVGIKKVEAKAVQNGSWTDISDTLYVDISDNCTVYVQATDNTGTVTAKSVYVECFDRVKPTVRASRSGRLLRIEASDDLSGVSAIFVDGEEFTDLTDGTLEYRLDTRNTKEDKIWIQAKDYAGNMSATVTITNPYYVDPDKKESASREDTAEKNTSNSTTDSSLVGSAATTTPPPSETATTTVVPAASSGATASEAESTANEGNRGTSGVIAVGNKQFTTIETRDEKIFYLIIDGDRDSDNVYLVTEVTAQDLQSFTADKAAPADNGGLPAAADPDPVPDTDSLIDGGELPVKDNRDDDVIPIGDAEPSGEDGESNGSEQPPDTDGEPAEDGKKASPIPGWIVIAILALIAAFAGYMFLIVLPRKKAREAFADIDEDDELEEEYADESEQPVSVEDGEYVDDEEENPLDIPIDDDED